MPDTFSSRNIVDFYYLEAMTDRAKRLPEVPLPSQEKWKSDLERLYGPFVKGFAASVRDYLFLACMGEARHAYAYAQEHFPELGKAVSRSDAYRRSLHYSPLNVRHLQSVFSSLWRERGYGGTKWGAVASAAILYGQVPDQVFLDLVIAIEHNNGNVFNKPDAGNVIRFECHMGFYYVIKGFLDHKFQQDILREPSHLEYLSRETLALLQRYYRVVSRRDAPRKLQELLGKRPPFLPMEYESPWGNQILGETQVSPERYDEEEHEEEETFQEKEEGYEQYSASVSATPKMPRGEHPDLSD